MPDRRAFLVLADGTAYEGTSFGYEGECSGEVVFNTGMTGYQEVLTDPSYKGQIVTMTYPEVGNTGINPEDVESNRPWVEGFIVREAWGPPSNWRHVESLDAYLRRYHVCGIAGIDTRALTRRLRDGGSQMAVLSATDLDADRLARKARELPSLVGRDLVKEVTSDHAVHWTTGDWDLEKGYLPAAAVAPAGTTVTSNPWETIIRRMFCLIPKSTATIRGTRPNLPRNAAAGRYPFSRSQSPVLQWTAWSEVTSFTRSRPRREGRSRAFRARRSASRSVADRTAI
ncbi:MAG TPA: carbamoyl-phosphate synthase domain-containing protein, partial [Candidatus Deferrimicrobium sp.]|nr:carbamoyl-phosphate synthase domain-containing protein [Candidatus Deferrimicrobium sp.]